MKKLFSRSRRNRLGVVVLVLSLTAVLWITCSEQSNTPSEPQQMQGLTVLSKANPKVQSVMSIQDRHTETLFKHPQVVGMGTGLTEEGKLAIVVYTESEIDQRTDGNLKSLSKADVLEVLPAQIEDVPVVTKVTGRFTVYADPKTRFSRPVPIGVSSGHPDVTAGTIGCRVKDGSGNVYALSNNHVYANINEAAIGDNVLQPGTYDGGQDPEDAIGTLYDYEPIAFDGSNNYIDAALAATSTANVGTATPSGDGYGTPGTTTVSASVGLKVQKYGRTTVWTHGEVSELNVTVDVCYESRGPFKCVKLARFVDQISITPGTFSDGGDSGSLIVTDDSNKNPVGLLFAGSDTRTLANPIDAVLSRFNVVIDDASGGTTNSPPTADFSFTTTDLTADFTDNSSDSDGSVVSWSWDFGDGSTSTSQNPSHTYAADGTYTVSLTVTDDDGATGSTSQDVTVSTSSGDGITLTATGYKVKGRHKADLEWSGATGTNVDIYRDGVVVATTPNDGFYTDNIDNVGGGSYTYKVCETDGSACSNTVTVNF